MNEAQVLLSRLRQRGVKVSLTAANRIRLEAPAGVLTPELKKAILANKPALLALLQQETELDCRGRVVRLYRARDTCLAARRCLQLTHEHDCRLFPLTHSWGWCRERVPAVGQGLPDGPAG